uniref:Putative ovule protein n=1 Tax=Solanum chacoense TaxID=4108 RepID=A0A0V0GU18_SOLCH
MRREWNLQELLSFVHVFTPHQMIYESSFGSGATSHHHFHFFFRMSCINCFLDCKSLQLQLSIYLYFQFICIELLFHLFLL